MNLDEDDNLSQSSAMDGTDEIPVDPDAPGLPTRGLPTRPTAERDVMVVLAAAFVLAAALTALTAATTWDGRAAAGPWPLFALVVPHLLILTAVLTPPISSSPPPAGSPPKISSAAATRRCCASPGCSASSPSRSALYLKPATATSAPSCPRARTSSAP